MVLFLFTNAILASEPKDAHNRGKMVRDFTYTDDIIEGVAHIAAKTPKPNPEWDGDHPDPASSSAPYKIYNIVSNVPVKLMDNIREIEKNLGVGAKLNLMPMQDGDLQKSHADVADLIKDFNYALKWPVKKGIKKFIQWYVDCYKVTLTTS
jgi:UDP-glucuronate 4-epimerase